MAGHPIDDEHLFVAARGDPVPADVAAHLAACDRCAARLARLALVRAVVRADAALAPSAAAAAAVARPLDRPGAPWIASTPDLVESVV